MITSAGTLLPNGVPGGTGTLWAHRPTHSMWSKSDPGGGGRPEEGRRRNPRSPSTIPVLAPIWTPGPDPPGPWVYECFLGDSDTESRVPFCSEALSLGTAAERRLRFSAPCMEGGLGHVAAATRDSLPGLSGSEVGAPFPNHQVDGEDLGGKRVTRPPGEGPQVPGRPHGGKR